MKVTVYALIAYDSETVLQDDFATTIQSLNNCQPPPSAIGIISCPALPTSLRKKNRLTIYKVPGLTRVRPLDVFRLPALMPASKDEAVYCLIVTPNNSYPPHMIEEYVQIHQKLVANKGNSGHQAIVCGLTGLKHVVDKKRQMDSEIEALAAGRPLPDPNKFMTVSYPIEHTPVDLLKFSGSVFFLTSDLSGLDVSVAPAQSEELLADYCKKSNICMFQVCTLTLNRIMFERMKMFQPAVAVKQHA